MKEAGQWCVRMQLVIKMCGTGMCAGRKGQPRSAGACANGMGRKGMVACSHG